MSLFCTLIITVTALLFQVQPATAHPHSWIDITSKVVFSEKGEIIALQQSWLFDEGYTVFVLENLVEDTTTAPDAATFQSIANKITDNLAPYGYFTKTKIGDTQTKPPMLTSKTAYMKDNRLSLDFTLTLQSPVPAPTSTRAFTYMAYDPTYYIEMLHLEDKSAVTLTGAPTNCTYSKTPPNPPMDAVIQASSMGPEAKVDDKLGELFAEKIKVTCP